MDNSQKGKIESMQEGGHFSAQLRRELVEAVRPGIRTMDLEEHAKNFYTEHNLAPSFLGYMGYPFNIVVCLNDEVVHGMPSEREIQKHDIVTVDLGVFHKGYHTDTATSVEAGGNRYAEFLAIGERSLASAIAQCRVGNHVGDISHAMQSVVEEHGFSVIRAFVGHGVGKQLHESMQIPCFGRPGEGEALEEGMTLAIEVMYTEKSYRISILDDGWTAVTKDGGLSAMFEHTIAITQDEPLILTN